MIPARTTTRLARTAIEFSRTLKQAIKSSSNDMVNMLHVHALSLIAEQPNMTMKEFADVMKITSPSATSFITRLVKQKLVRRRTSTKNRKVIHLSLTPLGKKVLSAQEQKCAVMMADIFRLISIEDQEHLLRIFTELTHSLHSQSK